ncbi:MAG: NAD(P)-dependent oxidoreductase [bacterium]|nr:NAD(P)-dependent oxidoreductase [bacterium]
MTKRVMITGGRGMLATDLTTQLSERGGYEVCPLSHAELDVTDGVRVKDAVEEMRPGVVIHTAAMHVDPCEEDPDRALEVNAWATRSLARACEQHGVTLVYISTCGLFGDRLRAYSEYDPVVLKTAYARSKYEGELFVRQFCGRHFIVRPGWLFGGSVAHAKNFVVKRREEATKAPVVRSVFDKHGSPTYTGDLSGRIADLLETDEYGTYHVTNGGGCSRAAYVRRILTCFGLETRVEEVDSSHYPRKADVPDCEILEGLNCQFLGMEPLPPWEEAVARYVEMIRDEVSG